MTIARRALTLLVLVACSPGTPCGDGRRQPGRLCIDWERPAYTHFGFAPDALLVTDVDGNGARDLVASSSARGSVSVAWGGPTGIFTEATTWSIAQQIAGLAVADLDGDGHLDIATAVPESDALGLLLGRGGREMGPARLVASGDARPRGLLAVQLDEFGPQELVAAHDGGTLSVLRMLAAGPPIVVGPGPAALAAADLDGDGDLDLAVALAERHAVQVMLGRGNGDLAPGPLHPVGAAPLAVVAADLDMDGVPDIATADALDDAVTILFGDGSGGLRARTTWPTLRDPRALIATTEEGAPVLYALSNRTSSVQRIAPLAGPTLAGGSQSPVTALAAGDLDGDMMNELLVASAAQGEISLLRASPGLTATESWQGPRISAAFPFDLDGDAIDELALLLAEDPDENMTESGSPGAPVLTIVRGDGTPLLDVETGLAGDVQQVRVADVNGDGRRDLLVLGYGGLVAHLQRVDGTFEPRAPYSLVGSAITAATLGDLDNDEAQDLLIATTAGLKGARMLGLSFVAEAPKVVFERELAGSVSSLIPVDQDGDAYLDVLGLLNFSPVLFPDVARSGEQVPVDRVGLGAVQSLVFESPGNAWACTGTGVVRVSDLLGPAQTVTDRLDDAPCDSVALVELDGDTLHDLIVRRDDESDDARRVVLTPWTRPNGVWTQLGSLSLPAADFRSIPVARFSGSGPDLLLDIPGEPVRTAKLSLAPAYASSALFSGGQTLRFVDVDGDGIHDVLGTGRTIGVALGDGDGGFGPLRQRAVATVLRDAEAISQTVISDLDADGRDEIFVAARRAGWSAGLHALTVEADGSVLSHHLGELPGGSVELLPADVDRDGSQDLFAVARTAPLRTALWRGIGGGDLADPEWTEQPGNDRAPANSHRFADLDRDGRLDLVGVSLTDGITVRAGQRDGMFAFAYPWSPLRFLSSISFGDLNLDGRLDLAGVRTGRLIVAHGGEGTARPPEVWLTDLRAATISDLDGEGNPEILALGPDAMLQVVRRDDAGRLDIARHLVRGPTPTLIQVEDLDGDGAPELILQGSGHLTVLMQRP